MNVIQTVLHATCDDIDLLFPLATVVTILSKNDTDLIWMQHNQIEYQKETYALYSMAEVLNHNHHRKEEYILLLREAEENFAIMIEAIHGVITLCEAAHQLPSYLPAQPYLISCSIISDEKLAYLIDVIQLLNQRKRI